MNAGTKASARDHSARNVLRVMHEHPTLTYSGVARATSRDNEITADRERMLSRWATEQFERAVAWLLQYECATKCDWKRCSYVLKHQAERWAGAYISNGMLIAAALHLGFKITPAGKQSPNVFLNIAPKESR